MAEKIRIGINFSHDENWMGGTYYFINLLKSFSILEQKQKPHIIVLSFNHSDYQLLRQSTSYPYLSFLNLNFPPNLLERSINKIWRLLFSENYFNKKLSEKHIDIMYPAGVSPRFAHIPRAIFWIPDLQDIHYPQFFSQQELDRRRQWREKVIDTGKAIVFSSQNVHSDFLKSYPDACNKTYILHFAVIHPEYNFLDINVLKKKYDINKRYFFSSNQFWTHKNHTVILKAIALLQKERDDFQVVFTGKEQDSRNLDYFISLKKFVSDYNLTNHVRFLGLIDRCEQLKLMSQSLAVIQSSLFEGWSTVVEDAKAMNKFILLSDLPVHREQISENCFFFNPHDEYALASEMRNILDRGAAVKNKMNYSESAHKFAKNFINIIQQELSQ